MSPSKEVKAERCRVSASGGFTSLWHRQANGRAGVGAPRKAQTGEHGESREERHRPQASRVKEGGGRGSRAEFQRVGRPGAAPRP